MTSRRGVPLFGTNPRSSTPCARNTDLVTVVIGGNDDSVFGTVVGTCPGLRASDPHGAPCQAHSPSTARTLCWRHRRHTGQGDRGRAGHHQRSPHAKVLVIGYRGSRPPPARCPTCCRSPTATTSTWTASNGPSTRVANAAAAADATTSTRTDRPRHDACAGRNAWNPGTVAQPASAAPYHTAQAAMVGEAGIIAGVLGVNRT